MSQNHLSFRSHFSNNTLIIVDTLGVSDLQTATHLRDSLLDSGIPKDYCRYFKINEPEELLTLLEEIREQCTHGLRPIIHVEAHGNKTEGIQVSTEGKYVPWEQLLPKFREINKESKNNLGVVMAACYGLYAIKPLSIKDGPCPFYFLIGPDELVNDNYIHTTMKLFYLELNRSNSLDAAMELVSDKFKQFHAEKFFYVSFAKYVKNACLGSGGKKRVERLLSKLTEDGKIANRENLRAARKRLKAAVKSPENAFNRHSEQFLHGRNSVTYEDFREFVKNKK